MDTQKTLVEELIEKLLANEREKALIVEDRRLLIADYKDRLDVKTVQAAMRIAKIRAKLDNSDEEIDNIISVVERNMSI